MTAEAEPETTPQMSPTTSLQKEDTLGALRMRRMASLASGRLRAAIEWKGCSDAVVTETPMMSNRMPTSTMENSTTKASPVPTRSSRVSDRKEKQTLF